VPQVAAWGVWGRAVPQVAARYSDPLTIMPQLAARPLRRSYRPASCGTATNAPRARGGSHENDRPLAHRRRPWTHHLHARLPGALALPLADRAAARRRLLPDANGRYALPLEAAQTIALALVEQSRAQQAVPHTFSPRIELQAAAQPRLATNTNEIGSQLVDPPVLPSRVDLADLLMSHRPSVDRILLAVGPGGVPLTVHAGDLCHVALAGATGGGKSNIMRLLLSQLLAAGAQVVLADPHYTPLDVDSGDDWRPIAGRLKLAPAVNAPDIGHLLTWLATEELPRRLELRRAGQRVGAPLFLAIDELPAIVADVKDAPAHMSRILREGRKVGLLTIGAAQDFLVKTLGGTGAVRDCYRTAFYVGGDQQTARVLLDVPGRVDDGQLGQGLAFLRSRVTTPAQLVRVPLASNRAITGLLAADDLDARVAAPAPSWRPAGVQTAARQDVDATASQSPPAPSVEHARILQLFRDGMDVAGVVREVYGVSSKQGRAYQEKSAEVQQVLRQVV
jgi:hypothetical protein